MSSVPQFCPKCASSASSDTQVWATTGILAVIWNKEMWTEVIWSEGARSDYTIIHGKRLNLPLEEKL